MIYKVEHDKDVFELNPELRAIKEFADLTHRQMVYTILVTDFKSPFRKLSLEEKKEKAAITAGFKLEKDGKRLDMNARNLVQGKVGTVEAGIKKYKELQRDEDYETLLSLSALISQIRAMNNKSDKDVAELAKVVDMNLKLSKLVEEKRKIEEILDLREDAPSDPTGSIQDDDESVDESNLPVLSLLNQGIIK